MALREVAASRPGALNALNRELPKYCTAERTRHGKVCVYFRRVGTTGRIRLRSQPLSPEFHEEYAAVLRGGVTATTSTPPPKPPVENTWRWLCTRYLQSDAFTSLASRGQRVRRRELEATWDEVIGPKSDLRFGDYPLDRFQVKAIRILRDRKTGWAASAQGESGQQPKVRTNTEAANSRLKYIRAVLAFGTEEFPDLVSRNWARDVTYFPSKGSFHTWTLEEVAQYEAAHPVGSRARLAMALGLYTGQRRGDLYRLGRHLAKNDLLTFVQEKNQGRKAVTAYVPIVPSLQRIIDASPTGDLIYIVQENGRPYKKESFGNRFRKWCREAGLPHCSAHGLRKACVVRLIMEGCTLHQIMAITGHQTLKEVDRYAREYLRESAALQVLEKWIEANAKAA